MNALLFAAEVFKWLPAAQAGVSGAWEALTWGKGQIDAMVAEKRDPSAEEWQALNARTDGLMQQLMAGE